MDLSLYDFQKAGVRFLLSRPPELDGNCHHILAHEPGLGKTVQACAGLNVGRARSGVIVAPIVAKVQWFQHLVDWADVDPSSIQIVNNAAEEILPNADWIIIHKELLVRAPHLVAQIMRRRFDAAIIDEAHCCQSIKTITSRVLLGAGGPIIATGKKFRWGFSGTIIPNRPMDLYAWLKVLAPKLIKDHPDYESFGEYYCAGFKEPYGGWNFKGASHIDELTALLKPFIQFQKIDNVAEQLPPLIEQVHHLTPDMNGMDEFNTHTETLRREIGIQKAPVIADFLDDKFQYTPETYVIFAHSRDVISYLTERTQKYGVAAIHGGVDKSERDQIKQAFLGGKLRGLVIQMQAGGEAMDGLQLVCNNVVVVQETWSYSAYTQAIARVRRLKQTRPTYVHRFIASNTFESVINYTRRAKARIIVQVEQPHNIGQDNMLEKLLEEQNTILKDIAAQLAKIASVPRYNHPDGPEVEVKEDTKGGKDKEDTKGGKDKGKDKGENKKTTKDAGSAEQKTSTNGAISQAELADIGLATLKRITADAKEAGDKDPQACARGAIMAAIQGVCGADVTLLKEVPEDKRGAVADRLKNTVFQQSADELEI